ncbi:MAG: HAMP domain-containing sensor histidine kinase [Chloroflexota bacterium]
MDYEKAFHAQTAIVNAVRDADRIDAAVLQLVCEQVCDVMDAHNVIVIELKGFSGDFETVAHARPLDERTGYAEAYIREDYEGESFTRDDVYVFALTPDAACSIISGEHLSNDLTDWLDHITLVLNHNLTGEIYVDMFSILFSESRNWLNSIRGWSDLLRLEPDGYGTVNQKQSNALEVIKRAASHLELIMADHRNAAGYRYGVVIRRERIDIMEIITMAVDHPRNLYRPDNIQIMTEVSISDPYLMGDMGSLFLCFTKLIDNAIKFSNSENDVLIRIQEDTERTNHILISIVDSGMGIPDTDGNKIFDLYKRSTNEDAQLKHGTGLGLYLAREIVKAHHGHIWYESEPGKGSTFYVSLPRTQPE